MNGVVVPGDVEFDGGLVIAVGVGDGVADGGLAVPGFIDVHINGFAGVDFMNASAADYARAGAALEAHGVTAYVPTFVTAPIERYISALTVVPRDDPRVLGVHLEGPFISPSWPGAHDPSFIRPVDHALALELVGGGPVAMVTLAPEWPGGLELIETLSAGGIVVSIGHSDADAATARAAFGAGAKAITHIYNAHRRWQPRDPGLAGAALASDDAFVQAIVDDVHLAPETATATFRACGERFVLVTDAIAAAGSASVDTQLADQAVEVRDGAARLPDGTLAGSVLTMDAAVRNLVAKGATLAQASYAASRAPALLIGRPELGLLEPGARADIAVLDDGLNVVRCLRG